MRGGSLAVLDVMNSGGSALGTLDLKPLHRLDPGQVMT